MSILAVLLQSSYSVPAVSYSVTLLRLQSASSIPVGHVIIIPRFFGIYIYIYVSIYALFDFLVLLKARNYDDMSL